MIRKTCIQENKHIWLEWLETLNANWVELGTTSPRGGGGGLNST